MQSTPINSTLMRSNCRRPALLALLLSITGGGLLTVVGFLLYYLGGGLTTAYPPLVWSGPQMTVVVGQGHPVVDSLEIQPTNNAIFFRFSPKGFMARPYGRLVWRIHGINSSQDVRLIWQIQSDPGNARQLPIRFDDLQKGQIDLRAQPDWRGYIVSLGFLVQGQFSQPLRVEQIALWSEPLNVSALLDQAWQEWMTSEYWSQRSAHFISGAPYRSLFHPVIVIAVWLWLSMILYGGFQLLSSPRQRWQFSPFIVLFLIGWWVVDLRWQMDLAQRTITTYQRFAGKDSIQKRRAADDGKLFDFLQKVRSYLPIHPVRIFIVNNDPANRQLLRNYMVARARYHLQPHNSFAHVYDWALLSNARPGDYILVLQPDKGALKQKSDLQYDPHQRQLRWASGGVPVEAIYGEPLGQLLRVPAS